MAAHVLVVATVTATSDDLLSALRERARSGSVPVDFTLVMPASSADRTVDEQRLEEALAVWREAGLKAEGVVGDMLPVQAVAEVCQPGRFDEVIVSTLPGQTSRWLRSDVPYRIGALTDLPVTHVVAMSMLHPPQHGGPPPERERAGIGLLNVMGYRGPRTSDSELKRR
jgi:hypothetical protein